MPRAPEDVERILAEDRFLRSLAWSILGRGDEADDAVQQTWLRSITHPPRKPAALRSFLSRILRSRVHTYRRDEKRRRQHEKAAAHPEALPSTEEMVAREELRRRVGEAVLALEEPYRTTIWLRFRDELPPREVAARMDVPVSTVRTRVRRALERMRSKLDERFGDRNAWVALITPCIGRAKPGAASAAVTVVGVMSMKKVFAAGMVLGLLLMVGLACLEMVGGQETRPEPRAIPAVADLPTNGLPETSRAPLDPTTTDEPAGPLRGTLVHADGQLAVGVPFWTWDTHRPRWARLPSEPTPISAPLLVDEPSGETDSSGGWEVPSGVEAVTFAPFELILVSYEVEKDPEKAEEGLTWELPPFAPTYFQIPELGPTDHWKAQLHPAIDKGRLGDPDAGWSVLQPHKVTGGTASVTLLEAVGETAELRTGADEVSFPTIPGLVYARIISGIGFEVEPELEYFVAPVVESLQVARRGPILRVQVMQPGGSLLAREDGRAVCWIEEDGRSHSRSRWEVEGGRASLPWGLLPTDVDHQIRVMMEDGEQFEAKFRFGPEELEKVLTFEQGQGLLPSLAIELPEAARIEGCSVVLEEFGGRLVEAKHYRDAFGSVVIPRTTTNFAERDRTLLLTRLPERWVQLWILTTGGRVANLRNPGAAAKVVARWLPDTELEAFDLAEPVADGRLKPGASYGYYLELVSTAGQTRMQSVDELHTSRDAYAWPVWEKRAPKGMQHLFVGYGAGRAEFQSERK